MKNQHMYPNIQGGFSGVLPTNPFYLTIFQACVDFMDRDAPLRPLVEMRRNNGGSGRCGAAFFVVERGIFLGERKVLSLHMY